jgi:sulfur-oxidizing protein SoxZ
MDRLTALQPRVRVPATARAGEIVEVRTLVSHPMETGFRRDEQGARVPRDILTHLVCEYAGREVFRAELQPAISANPYVAFHFRATVSGAVTVRWEVDGTVVAERTETIEVLS